MKLCYLLGLRDGGEIHDLILGQKLVSKLAKGIQLRIGEIAGQLWQTCGQSLLHGYGSHLTFSVSGHSEPFPQCLLR